MDAVHITEAAHIPATRAETPDRRSASSVWRSRRFEQDDSIAWVLVLPIVMTFVVALTAWLGATTR